MSPIQDWYEVAETHNMRKLDFLLDDNVVFYSPIVSSHKGVKKLLKLI